MAGVIGNRISVVGTTGSGKTTTAQEISKRLNLPYIELDALYWTENWEGVPEEEFRFRIKTAIASERWVIDGNYSRIRPLVWEKAEMVVYLDFSFWQVFWQLLTRTLRRSIQREVLWGRNRESIGKAFFSRDSILVWMLTTYHRRRRQYPVLFQKPEYAHLQVVHLRSPKETKAWLASLSLSHDVI